MTDTAYLRDIARTVVGADTEEGQFLLRLADALTDSTDSPTKYEAEFRRIAAPALEKLNVRVVECRHLDATDLIAVVLRLPPSADATTRRTALAVLGDFERQLDYEVVTDPTFVWDQERDA